MYLIILNTYLEVTICYIPKSFIDYSMLQQKSLRETNDLHENVLMTSIST